MLRAADVWFAYRAAPVLRGVSVDVSPGDVVGIIGPNGSGKTTMLRVLAGTRRPARGQVTLDGTDLARVSRTALARRMAVVPQETHLAFDYSVLELVLMGRYPHLATFALEGPADLAIARAALAATGTLAFEDRLFETLSGGEKQRVVIAAALAQISAAVRDGGLAGPARPDGSGLRADGPGLRPGGLAPSGRPEGRIPRGEAPGVTPGILLLDEPTAALDLGYQLETAALLRDLQRRTAISIVISTHDLNFAAAVCRTLVLLKDGEVLASGVTDEVLTPALIAALYGVEADVRRHDRAGHLVVVPVGRSTKGTPP